MTLIIRNASKNFKNTNVIQNLNIKATRGEIFGLIGQNGAGKTTTFRMILNLIKPTSGEILWDDKEVSNLMKSKIGYLPEERGLYPKLTVEEQIIFFGNLKGKKTKELKEEMEKWISFFDLNSKRKVKTEKLSKGNQQKVQLITSFIHKPSFLILDEPFSGLDPINAELLKKAILLLKQNGTTIIFSTHRMDHIEELCDNICLLKAGKVLFSGSLNELKSKYGKNQLLIKGQFNKEDLMKFPGVVNVSQDKDEYLLTLKEEKYGKEIFSLIKDMDFVEKFSLDYQSLDIIFKKEVGENGE